MVMLLSEAARARLVPSEQLPALPVPPRIVSNGEYTPPPQSAALRAYQARLAGRAERRGRHHGVGAAAWLRSRMGMAAAFEALNESFGAHFAVGKREAEDPEAADAERARVRDQFVFDDQVHFLKDDADPALFTPLTSLIELSAELLGLPHAGRPGIEGIRFPAFLKDLYLDSDTKLALLSGAPGDDAETWMLSNDQMASARAAVNAASGGRRLLTHAVIAPGHPGWLDEVDRVHEVLRPEGWKGYTVGEPFSPSRHRWRMDDLELVGLAYERIASSGVKTFCVHKGLLPEHAEDILPGAEPYARVDDVAGAALAFPEIAFVIYHAGYRTIPQPTAAELARFEETGRIDWVSDLAELPAKHGVSNVYADIGASFAFTVLTHPRLAAAMIGILVKGLGADHVLWGTDSVWYGSPQWQIEAFRRLQMPEDLQERFGLPDLGPADGPLKSAILGLNGARLYGIDPADYAGPRAFETAHLDRITADYRARGGSPSNLTYGYAAAD